MAKLMRIPEAASVALHSMAVLAEGGSPVTTREIAGRLGASEAHLAKVMQRLEAAGLVKSSRGPGGGHALALSPESITLKQIYEAVEGRLSPTQCLLEAPICGGGKCPLGKLLETLDRRLRKYLETTPLSRLSLPEEVHHA